MSRRQPAIALLLALAVANASAVCACALPDADPPGTSGHHDAHHHSADAPLPSVACSHADCNGDCAVAGLLANPTATAEPPRSALEHDDGTAATAHPAIRPAGMRTPLHHHPPPRVLLPANSPVQRFDKLLN